MDRQSSISDLARHAGTSVETIRYYERAGLLPPPSRTASGRRVYGQADFKTLAFIRKARSLGFTLDDIRGLLALRGPDSDCSDVKAIAQRHLDNVRSTMRTIVEVERVLADALARCPGGPARNCALLEMLEQA
jgi:MerR family mercuric resistance operon transcriptional regulator